MDVVDKDGSGEIDFDEFLKIINLPDDTGRTKKMQMFFKDLAAGKFTKDLPFQEVVMELRRQSMMDAIIGCQDPTRFKLAT